jgi:hypothetical protein
MGTSYLARASNIVLLAEVDSINTRWALYLLHARLMAVHAAATNVSLCGQLLMEATISIHFSSFIQIELFLKKNNAYTIPFSISRKQSKYLF